MMHGCDIDRRLGHASVHTLESLTKCDIVRDLPV